MEQLDYLILQDKTLIVLAFVTFIVFSVLVMVLANLKNLMLVYEHSEEEEEGWEEMAAHSAGKEISIRDIMRTSTFRGFSAV